MAEDYLRKDQYYVLESEGAPVCIVSTSRERVGFRYRAGPFDTWEEAYAWMCDNC